MMAFFGGQIGLTEILLVLVFLAVAAAITGAVLLVVRGRNPRRVPTDREKGRSATRSILWAITLVLCCAVVSGFVAVAARAWPSAQRPIERAAPQGTETRLIISATEIRTQGLALVDETGNERAWFGVGQEGEIGLYCRDKNRTVRLSMSVMPDGTPLINLSNSAGKHCTTISVHEGGPILFLSDASGHHRLALLCTSEGSFVNLFRETDLPEAQFSLNADGPLLAFWDEKGTIRATFGSSDFRMPDNSVRKMPPSTLVLFSEKGRVAFKAP